MIFRRSDTGVDKTLACTGEIFRLFHKLIFAALFVSEFRLRLWRISFPFRPFLIPLRVQYVRSDQTIDNESGNGTTLSFTLCTLTSYQKRGQTGLLYASFEIRHIVCGTLP